MLQFDFLYNIKIWKHPRTSDARVTIIHLLAEYSSQISSSLSSGWLDRSAGHD